MTTSTILSDSPWARRIRDVALLAVVYALVGKASLLLAIAPGYAAAMWPAAGIALMALMLRGPGLWPGVWIGSFLVNVGISLDPSSLDPSSLVEMVSTALLPASLATGATAQALLGTWVARRVLGSEPALVQPTDVLRFVTLVAAACCSISALWGVGSLYVAGQIPTSNVLYSLTIWWVGDTIGVLVIVPLVLAFVSPERSLWAPRVRTVAVPLALSLLTVMALFVFTSKHEERRLRLEFRQVADLAADALGKNLVRYIEVLLSVRALYNSSTHVSRAEFHSFVQGPLLRIPGIQALSWNPRVTAGSRAAFEKRVREEGFPGFEIREHNSHAGAVSAAMRDAYVVVDYIEPIEGNEAAMGLDIASDPTRLSALTDAARTGETLATAAITLVQETGQQAATLILIPVYDSVSTATSGEERIADLDGYVVAAIRIGDVLHAALSELGMQNMTARLDDVSDDKDTLLAAYTLDADGRTVNGTASVGAAIDKNFAWTRSYTFGHRNWALRLAPTAQYLADHRSWGQWGGLAAALGATGGLAVFLLIVTGRMHLDKQRTREIALANIALENEIARREKVESSLAHERSRAEVTLNCIGEAVIRTGPRGHVDYLNHAAEKLIGRRLREARGRMASNVLRIVDENTRAQVPDPIRRCLDSAIAVASSGHEVLQAHGGAEFGINFAATPLRADGGDVLGAVMVINDVSSARRSARQAALDANVDALTGLVNRREFERRLDRALASARGQGVQHVLCFLDLDHFKAVNDTAGHQAGDHLLRDVAALLGHCIRGRDTLARLGGDEFAVILDNCPLDKAQAIAETMVSAIHDFEFTWEDQTFRIGVSMGLVHVDGAEQSAADLVDHADAACYTAKRQGRNQVCVYQHRPPSPSEALEAEPQQPERRATTLDENNLRLLALPVRRIAPHRPPGTIAHEVLLEVLGGGTHPATTCSSGILAAGEHHGLTPHIDRWVIASAIAQMGVALGEHRSEPLSINICADSMNDESFIDFVREQFADHQVPPGHVCFEISETAAMENLSAVTHAMSGLREIGCCLALDDFGTGLSAFRYLKALPLDFVKFDGGIIRRLPVEHAERTLVAAMCDVAHVMGIQTVADGVDSEECLAALHGIGIDHIQGKAVAEPLPLETLLHADAASTDADADADESAPTPLAGASGF